MRHTPFLELCPECRIDNRRSPPASYGKVLKYIVQYRIGVFLLAVGAPVIAGAAVGGVIGLMHVEVGTTCDEEGTCTSNFGSAMGLAFGIVCVAALGAILTAAMITAGTVLIAMNARRVRRLKQLMDRHPQARVSLRLLPSGFLLGF